MTRTETWVLYEWHKSFGLIALLFIVARAVRGSKAVALSKLPENALESFLAKQYPGDAVLVRARSGAVTLPQFAYDYRLTGVWTEQKPGQLGRNWDWLWLLPRLTPVTMVQ